MENNLSKIKCPLLYENWICKNRNEKVFATYEYPFFSDVPHLFGNISKGLEPYYLLNTIAKSKQNNIAPVIIFRVDWHSDPYVNNRDFSKTDTVLYHNGWFNDEMAALVSLCLGIRLKSGNCIRQFDNKTDIKGEPRYMCFNEDPILIKKNDKYPIIPNAICEANLNNIKDLLMTFPKLSPEAATVLVKSARLYQEALWLSEVQPELSWLLFVSAVEKVALFHIKSKKDITEFRNNIKELLLKEKDNNLISLVKKQVLDYEKGITRKFIEFLVDFLPDSPQNRSTISLHKWDKDEFRKSFKKIYEHRSKALHDGTPFPYAMWEPSKNLEGGYIERPLGIDCSGKQAVWKQDDLPMLLHLFEYIVRNALLKWWKSLIIE